MHVEFLWSGVLKPRTRNNIFSDYHVWLTPSPRSALQSPTLKTLASVRKLAGLLVASDTLGFDHNAFGRGNK